MAACLACAAHHRPVKLTPGPVNCVRHHQHSALCAYPPRTGDSARVASHPLLWDPSDTREFDPGPSCLRHTLLTSLTGRTLYFIVNVIVSFCLSHRARNS